jgi:hypothetical protein
LGPVISLVGTKHHSVATIDDFGNCYYYRNDPYTMDSLYEASIIAYNGLYSSIAYLKIDDKLYIISFGGNNEMVNMDNGFSCYQKSNDEIVIQFSDRISDEKLIVLTDVMGKTIFNEEVKFINGKGIIIKGSICPGVYLINAIKGNYASATKIILN